MQFHQFLNLQNAKRSISAFLHPEGRVSTPKKNSAHFAPLLVTSLSSKATAALNHY